MKTGSERDELRSLLHPADPLDVPIPGFPSHDALVAWAKTKDVGPIREAAVEALREDAWPQQYAAMALLRELGLSVEGEGHGGSFRWVVQDGGQSEVIEPKCKPLPDDSTDDSATELETLLEQLQRPSGREVEPWVRELRNLLAHAIIRLDDRSKIVLTLHYFEGLTYDEVGEVLDLTPPSVETILRNGLHEVRGQLTTTARQELRRYLDDVLDTVPLDAPALTFAALLAA